MQRKFITNLLFLLFINLLVKPFWIFGVDRAVQNQVGSEAYGEYFILFNFSLLLNILLDLGITNFNNRNISMNRQLLPKHLPGIIVLKIVLGLVYLAVTLGCAFYFQFSAFRIKLLLLLTLNQFLVSFILYLRSNMAALHLFKTDSIISVLDRLLMIAFCSLLIWGGVSNSPLRIEWFVYAQTISYIMTAGCAFVLVFKKAPFQRLVWNNAFLINILKKSAPFALLVLLMYFYNRMDTIMLDVLLENGAHASGMYAQAYRLLDAVNMIGFLTAGLLYPIFSYLIKQQKPTAELVKTAFGLLTALAIPTATISWFFATPIMEMLYVDATAESAALFQWLMSAFVPVCFTYVFGTLLTANGSLKPLNLIALSGVLINFGLNYLLIPTHGAIGSAFATLFTQYLTAIAQVFLAIVIFRYRFNIKLIGTYLLFILLCIGGTYVLQLSSIDWGYQFLLSGLFALLVGLLTRLINIKSMRYIIKYEKG
jgi:O-antigen/teichoic acid export membrane protein